MKLKKIAGILTVLGMLPAMGTSVCAAEVQEPVGYVSVCIEKFTIGQEYLLEPENIPFYEGETGVDVLERAYGAENFNDGKGIGSYISSVYDAEKNDPVIPEFIRSAATAANIEIDNVREKADMLSSYDFCSMSGWLYLVNNVSPSFMLGDYEPQDGDVLRLAFSVYGYGSDFGLDTSYMAEWGGTEPLCPTVNRDRITSDIASYERKGEGVYIRAVKTAANLLSDQDAIDKAVLELKFISENGLSMGDIDQNREVDVFDAIAAAQSTVGKKTLSEKEEVLADMNGDFAVDVFDAVAIARLTV